MPLFSFRRSSAPDSGNSTASSLPLNDTRQETEPDVERQTTQKERAFLGKLRTSGSRSKGIRSPGVRNGRRSRSPINPNIQRQSKSRSQEPTPPPTVSPTPKQRQLTKKKFLPQPTYRRLGTTFCFMCDMRIATALLNTMHIATAVGIEVFEYRKWGGRNYFSEPPILLLVAIGGSGMGIFGALHFLWTPLMISSVFLCLMWYLYLVELHLFGLFLVMLIIFSQCILADEVRRGIMHEETYRYEEYIEPEGRKMIKNVHSLSVDIGETAVEFAEEVKTEVKRQTSGQLQSTQPKQKKAQGC